MNALLEKWDILPEIIKGLMDMKVLWLCGIVLPHLCDEFGFKKTVIKYWKCLKTWSDKWMD